MKNSRSRSKTLNIILWIAQFLLGAFFFMSGFSKLTQPIAKLAEQAPVLAQVSQALIKFIGTCEILGAIGIVLPALLRVKPNLTPLAAAGFTLLMVIATSFNLIKGAFSGVPITMVLGLIAFFVAWGRFKKRPIYEKRAPAYSVTVD